VNHAAQPAAHPQGTRGTHAPAAWVPRQQLEAWLCGLDTALAADPESTDLMFQRASTLHLLGREEESRAAYLQTLQKDPDHLGVLSSLGRNLITSRHYTAARIVLERAVEKYPGDLASHIAFGLLLYQTKKTAAARSAFETALRIAPADAHAHTGMSFVLDRLGDRRGAAAHRKLGFRNRTVIPLAYRGQSEPVRVLLLASANGANAPVERFLDDRVFQTWIVVPEFHDADVPLPEHALVVNAIGDVDADPVALRAAQAVLARTSAPVINALKAVAPTGRCENWRRLAQIPGVITPRAATLPRAALSAINAPATLLRHGLAFPLLLRSPGYHGGENFVRVNDPQALNAALDQLPGDELIAIEFIDTGSGDGKTRKYRVMMIDGQLYPLHLAVGSQWKLHFFSADMAECAEHRTEDANFLTDMGGVLGRRAMHALRAIQTRLGLDYAGIDFGLSPEGEIVVFEANATMIVALPEKDPRWDYRRAAVDRIDTAVRRMLLDRAQGAASEAGPSRRSDFAVAITRGSNNLNFSAGPGALPVQVLQEVQQAIIALPETGLSVLGMSHRSAWFDNLLAEAEDNLRRLMAIPPSHRILFLQGGSSLQFSMIPMNFAAPAAPTPLHVRSGYWSAKAIAEAQCLRPLQIIWDGANDGFRRMPTPGELATAYHSLPEAADGAPYLHYVSNETVEGLQCKQLPRLANVPLIADMSSDFLSQPVDFSAHAFVYAHAQKNLGPAGVTLCVIDEALLDRTAGGLPPMLDYRTHLSHRSNYNTPPVFGIYVLTLVTRWLRDVIGGVPNMQRINQAKADCLYGALDRLEDVLQPHANAQFRSIMNASFRFRAMSLNKLFLKKASDSGFSGLAGHRALGGVRASLYNAVTQAAVAHLCDFLEDFAKRYG